MSMTTYVRRNPGIDWTGDGVGNSTIEDKSPLWVKDFVGKYASQLEAMRQRFGVYPGAQLRPGVGFTLPKLGTTRLMAINNAWALVTYWRKLGQDMYEQATLEHVTQIHGSWIPAAVKNLTGTRAGEAAQKVAAANAEFKRNTDSVLTGVLFSDEVPFAQNLWLQIRRYAIALSGAIWSGYSLETSFERAISSTKQAAVEAAKKIPEAMNEVLATGELLWKVVKWGTIGLVALSLGWTATKIVKKGK